MTYFNEEFEKFADLQKQGLEPARKFAGVAAEAFEQIARKNYAFLGDVLEYTVAFAKLPVDAQEPKDLYDRQVASTREFAELVNTRATEYVELGKEFQETAASIFNDEVVEPVAKASKEAVKKAA